jgi:ribonuclease D
VATPTLAAGIDVLSPHLDWTVLHPLLKNPAIIKVFHAARQDMEIFHQALGQPPAPVFDTQIAAMVLGFGESVGYETLVTQYLKAPLNKNLQFSNWAHRPLTSQQVDYALNDVVYLCSIYESMRRQLQERNRFEWIAEEMAALESPSLYENHPEEAWQRLKVRQKSPRFLNILRAVAEWREKEAQRRNQPRNRILRDETLLDVAHAEPSTAEALYKLRGLPPGFGQALAQSLLEAIREAGKQPKENYPSLPRYIPRQIDSGALDLLKTLLRHTCQNENIASRLVASGEELEEWLDSKGKSDARFMEGWRYDIFGHKAVDLLSGKLALGLDSKSLQLQIFTE